VDGRTCVRRCCRRREQHRSHCLALVPAQRAHDQSLCGPDGPTTAAPSTPIEQIRNAPDPSSAVDAYTRAQAAEPANLELKKAYVHRMVELNSPEMAAAQARDVVAHDPSDGVAQAVSGYMDAEHGQSGQAAQKLELAVRSAAE
jgi:hypothetical protein